MKEPITGTDTNPIITNENDIWFTSLWFVGFWQFRLSKKMNEPVPESNKGIKVTQTSSKNKPHKPITNNFQKKKFSSLDFFTKR